MVEWFLWLPLHEGCRQGLIMIMQRKIHVSVYTCYVRPLWRVRSSKSLQPRVSHFVTHTRIFMRKRTVPLLFLFCFLFFFFFLTDEVVLWSDSSPLQGQPILVYHETLYPLCWDMSSEVTRKTLSRLICLEYGLEPLTTLSLIGTTLYDFDRPKLFATCTGYERSVQECLIRPVITCSFSGVMCKPEPRSSGEWVVCPQGLSHSLIWVCVSL